MKDSYEVEKLKKLEMEEEEEEKEQSSPVSVLDPPFQDDDEDIHMDDNNIPSSFRSVQSTFSNHSFVSKFSQLFFHLIPSYQTIDSSLNGYRTVVRMICF